MRINSGVDREYDSFEQFAKDAPWLAGLVFFVVALVFLVPLLIIVLLIWYKVRKNRMLNETMIKLAEKGVVPPAEAMEALSANRVGAAVTSSPATAPMYEQAKALRRRAAWSELRKGVLLIAVASGEQLSPTTAELAGEAVRLSADLGGPVTALLAGKINSVPGTKVVSILSGGNVDRSRLKEIL